MSEDNVKRDREYWTRYAKELIRDWLTSETSIEAACACSKGVYLNNDLGGFTGETEYVRNLVVQRAYTKLRMATAEGSARGSMEKKSHDPTYTMNADANFAIKHALAFAPVEWDVAGGFTKLLTT